MNIVIGNQGAVEQPPHYGWSPDRGYTTTREWRGSEVACKIIANQLLSQAVEYELVGGAVWSVTGKYANPVDGGQTNAETPSTTWEFFAGEVERDVLAADVASINGLFDADKEDIRDAVDGDKSKRAEIAALGDGVIKQTYQRMLEGYKSIIVASPALRKSQLVSNSYIIPNSLANVGNILTYATLISSEPTIPAAIANNIPNDSSIRTGLRVGWYKVHPQIQQVGFNKFQVSQEFRYGLWINKPVIYTFV